MKKFLLYLALCLTLLIGYLLHLGAKPEDILCKPFTVLNDFILKKYQTDRDLTATQPQATPASSPWSPQATAQAPGMNFDLAQLSQSRAEWPQAVVLNKAVEFPAVLDGKVVGTVKAPYGTRVRLVMVRADKIGVEYKGGGAMLDASDTDLAEQVMTARRTASLNIPAATQPSPPQSTLPLNPPLVVQTGTSGPSPTPDATKSSLDKFVAAITKSITTPAPPFILFFDLTKPVEAAANAHGKGRQLTMEKKLAIERYNAFVGHEFPDKPDMKLRFDGDYKAPVRTGKIEISAAKILWLLLEEGSEDASHILKWVTFNDFPPPPEKTPAPVFPIPIVQDAMQALDGELASKPQDADAARILKYLRDAHLALQDLVATKKITEDDQRKIVFFLKAAGMKNEVSR